MYVRLGPVQIDRPGVCMTHASCVSIVRLSQQIGSYDAFIRGTVTHPHAEPNSLTFLTYIPEQGSIELHEPAPTYVCVLSLKFQLHSKCMPLWLASC